MIFENFLKSFWALVILPSLCLYAYASTDKKSLTLSEGSTSIITMVCNRDASKLLFHLVFHYYNVNIS